MTRGRGATLLLLLVATLAGLTAVAKRADRARTGEQPTPVLLATQQVKLSDKRAAQQSAPVHRQGVVRRIVARPVTAGRQLYRYVITRRIQATQLRIRASLAQDPDNFDARERLWMQLHRLQHRRDALA